MAKRPIRRASQAAERDRARNLAGALKFGLGALVVVGVVATYLVVSRSQRDLDATTLCPAQPESITVLLVDLTDPLNVPQRQDFRNQLANLRNSIPRYGKLVVAKVDATNAELISPVVVRCNPGTASDVSESTGNPAAVQRLHDEKFIAALDDAFRVIAEASPADQSPIFESVQSVALTELLVPGAKESKRKIVLVSDLLQNTSDINFYARLPDPNEFASSNAFRRVRTDLSGVDVELWMLERGDAGRTQPRALIELWDHAIAKQGGTVSRAYNVSG